MDGWAIALFSFGRMEMGDRAERVGRLYLLGYWKDD